MTRAADKRSLGRRPSVIKHRARKGEAPPPPEPVRAPTVGHMVPTEGDRDETCAHYDTCLTAHVEAHKRSDPPASCPPVCRFREATTERATDHVSAGGCYLARAASQGVW
ncbi:MAG TPA: hypothetical protein VLT61_03500 [Anaeromyxobacteraceae bacterium]|nr:hypothetical protein [Anaeromyxobacteraceae bacterium]